MPATREAVNQASAMAEADLSLEKGVIRGPSTASPVHAAAVNGDKAALQKLIAGSPELKDEEDRLGRTPLMYCVLADRLDCAVLLLKAGADVNKADRSQRSALHMAAQKGNYRIMKLLLVRRANWMQKDLEETTPLHLATRHKSAKCLALLLKHMAPGEVDSQDRNKQTALHWSAYHNNPEHGRLLVKHNSNIGIPDVEGRIPLHWAAHSQDPSAVHMVRCILDAAPTESLLNWQDYEGRTPLHFAVADGNEAVVDVLTSYAGCNVTSYDNLFRTPLHWAALLGHARIAHLLLERNRSSAIPSDGQGATPLHYAAQSNFPETVEVFLRHPSVKDDTDLEGRTAFMWAAGKGSDAVIRAMLALKPDLDINLADSYGGTALHAASLSGHVSTVRLLLERGVRVDATDVMNHTPLFRACEMGHKEVIQTLIEGGARVDLVDQDGHSPLHWAALGGNANVCQILIENKINPNVQDSAGRTPLQCAAYGGYINCMAVLMENKADTNIQDKEGRTALHWSCNNGYLDAVKLLLAFDAFPNQMENNEERYTPLDYALLGEHHEVIQFMLERGALSIAAIQDIAASKIQAIYKGYKVRKAFQDRKILLMKHEQLRKDAAAKKREEGHKRREALGDGKGVQSQTGPVIEGHQPPARREDSGVPWQLLGGEEADSASTSPRSQEEESNDGSPRAAKNKSPPKEPSPPSEDGKRKKGGPRRSSKGRSTGVYLDSGGGAKEDPQCTSSEVSMPVSSRRKGRTHRDQSVDAHGEGPPGSKSQVLGLPLEGPNQTSQDSSCQYENMAKCLESMSFSGGNPKSSKPGHLGKTVPRPKQGKDAATQVLDGGRCSPAGSSRPCSAKRGSGKGINNGAKGSSTPQSHVSPCPLGPAVAAGCAPGDVAMPSLPGQITNLEKTHAAGTAFRLCSPVSWQSQNIEAIPAAIRLAVIERERARKDLFRKKVHAAEVIQEGWRHYRLRQELSLLLNTERCGAEADDRWRRQTMACVVRLAWRKRLDQSPVPLIAPCRSRLSQAPPLPAGQSPVFSRPSGRRAPTKSAKLPPTALQQVYGSAQEGKRRRPCRLPSRHRLSARDLILGGTLIARTTMT